MSAEQSLRDAAGAARRLLLRQLGGGSAAILTTVSPEGRPHATWMATLGSSDVREIATITSPDSEKVKNIRANPRVEWLFTAPDRRSVVCVEGSAEIVEDVAEIKRCWAMIGNKEQAFFLRFFNSAMGFAVVKTTVETAVYGVPAENLKVRIPVDELNAGRRGDAGGGEEGAKA